MASDVQVQEHRGNEVLPGAAGFHHDLESAARHLFHAHHFDGVHSNRAGDLVGVSAVDRDQLIEVDLVRHIRIIGVDIDQPQP